MCRVEFSKIGKRDVTFIREMTVEAQMTKMVTSHNGLLFPQLFKGLLYCAEYVADVAM